MARFEHKLPAILEPVGDICVEVTIPAHPDYVALFIRAVRMLETNRLYERDENLSAKTVVNQWRQRTITPLIDALASGTGICGAGGDGCLAYPPFASFISYSPQNPFTDPDLVPDGYEQPPFFVNGRDNEHDLPNYNRGDVILDFGSINIEPSWDLAKTPRIELCLEGSGAAKIHFLNIVQGGVAIVSVDNPVDLGDIIGGLIGDGIDSIDLNQDIVSLPPETAEEIIIEVEVDTEGEHIIYIYFLPTVNDSLIPLAFGGGIRSIELCGTLRPCGTPPPAPPPPLEGVTELKPEFQFTAECGFEYRLKDQNGEIVQDWTPVAGWDENAGLCFGGGDVATKQDIKEALIEWTKDTALKIVSGATGGIVIDEDGNVTIGGEDGAAGLPEDDPATDVDETAAARSGGASAVRIGINSIWSNLNSWYGLSVPEASVVERLTLLYELNAVETAEFVAYYYAQRAASQQYVSSFASTLDGYLYCKGNNKQVLAEWIFEVGVIATIAMASLMVEALTQGQMDNWFSQGMEVPSTDYQAYSCVPIDPEQWVLDAAYLQTSTYKTGASIGKNNHRILIEVSGKVNHPSDGSYQDFFYHVAANGTKSYVGIATGFGSLQFSDNLSNPPQSKVPWKASGVYAVTMETTSAQAYRFRRVISAANQAAGTTGFTIKLTDLGEVIN
jgi:hypothetical protein